VNPSKILGFLRGVSGLIRKGSSASRSPHPPLALCGLYAFALEPGIADSVPLYDA
jgi:hypothetical protein